MDAFIPEYRQGEYANTETREGAHGHGGARPNGVLPSTLVSQLESTSSMSKPN
jgi:hypothetical protein